MDRRNANNSDDELSVSKVPQDFTNQGGSEFTKNVPNLLTLLRILAIPGFILLLTDPSPQSNLWATVIFIVASLTDWLDGYIARAYHAESILGTLLDPLADKILVMAALVMLAATPTGPRVAAWMVVALLAREFIVTGLRSLAAVKGMIVPATNWAKHKTAWTFIAIICLLIDEPIVIAGTVLNFRTSGTIFMWIALFFSVSTGIHYAVKLRKLFT